MRRIHHRWAWPAIVATLLVWPVAPDRVLPREDGSPPGGTVGDAGPLPAAVPEPTGRLREGSVLANVPGTFQAAGERITFCPSDREAVLPVLENLALERIEGMLETAGGRLWSVSGTVTEFRGRNYLLISRAVIRAPRPAPAAGP